MKYEDIDLNDWRNPYVSEVNGVLLDTRFLRANVKGTKAHYMKTNLHLCHYCPTCYMISNSGFDHVNHFKRRPHLKAVAEKKKKPKFQYY